MNSTGTMIRITPDGDVSLHAAPGDGGTLRLMRQLIGCRTVDLVRLTTVAGMRLDDEGLCAAPPGPLATLLARRHGWTLQPCHGTVLIAGHHGPDTAGLTGDQARAIPAQLTGLCA